MLKIDIHIDICINDEDNCVLVIFSAFAYKLGWIKWLHVTKLKGLKRNIGTH